jgi:RHS repeat-associated protein
LQVQDSRNGAIKYHYDAAHLLKVVEREDGRNEIYAHDNAGNLTLQPGLNDVRIGSGNKLKTANNATFHYDHRDNVVMRKSERKRTDYEYDSFDQLSRISLNGHEWRSDYDALGRRTRKRWSGQTTEYYWDYDRLAGEIRGDGSVRIYVYADEWALVPFLYVDYATIDTEPENGVLKYLFTNHLGVPERVEDESGRAIWQGEVSPYGSISVEFGDRDEINIRFPGHYHDVETGLHYNRFRYYDPTLGCYLQSDPLGIAGGTNLYAYLTNPLTDVDILGLKGRGSRGAGGCDGEGSGNDGPNRGPVRPKGNSTTPSRPRSRGTEDTTEVVSPTGTRITYNSDGRPVRWEWEVGPKGERGPGYEAAEVDQGSHRGHVRSVNEGAGRNSIDDSPDNIVQQSPTVNLSNVKRFENWRVKNAQGEQVIAEQPDENGMMRWKMPGKGIDTTFDPNSTNRWPDEWFKEPGPWE